MNVEREVWSKILSTTAEMLQTAHKRNDLLKESESKEREVRKEEEEYNKFLAYIEQFNKEHADGELGKQIELMSILVKNRLSRLKYEAQPLLLKYEQAIRMYDKIEEYKVCLESFLNVFKNLKLTQEEVLQQDAKELIALILIANDKDYTITEENFFADDNAKKAYFEMIPEGIMLHKNTITRTEMLDAFLEKL